MAIGAERPWWQKREFWLWAGGFLAALAILVVFGRVPRERASALVGKTAPDIVFGTESGERRTLSDYRGSVVLVNFWAAWCQPCMEEMPALAELERKLGDRGLVLLAINVAGDDPALLSKIPPDQLPSRLIYRFEERTLDPYSIDVIPLSVLVDREGTIRELFWGPRDWASGAVLNRIEKML